MPRGYDIDGVITEGCVPRDKSDVIITGRSYEEAMVTYNMLRRKGIFNAVYLNPVDFDSKTIENSGEWKGKMAKLLGVTTFYEDDPRQAEIIKSYGIQTVLVTKWT